MKRRASREPRRDATDPFVIRMARQRRRRDHPHRASDRAGRRVRPSRRAGRHPPRRQCVQGRGSRPQPSRAARLAHRARPGPGAISSAGWARAGARPRDPGSSRCCSSTSTVSRSSTTASATTWATNNLLGRDRPADRRGRCARPTSSRSSVATSSPASVGQAPRRAWGSSERRRPSTLATRGGARVDLGRGREMVVTVSIGSGATTTSGRARSRRAASAGSSEMYTAEAIAGGRGSKSQRRAQRCRPIPIEPRH